jgi:hypothetical protein
MNLAIDQFSPLVAQLTELAHSAKQLPPITSIDDTTLIEQKKEKLKELVKGRTTVQKIGKEMRDEANAFSKAVIAKEKEVLAITQPIEDEFKAEFAEVERLKEIEQRKQFLPARKAEMTELGVEIADEELLAMESIQYTEFKNLKTQAKLDSERMQIEADRKAIEEEKQRIEREKELEQARKEAHKKALVEAEERAQLEAEQKEKARIESERIAQENAKAEAEKMRKNKTYQDWVASLSKGVKIEREGDTFIAYKEISRIIIK